MTGKQTRYSDDEDKYSSGLDIDDCIAIDSGKKVLNAESSNLYPLDVSIDADTTLYLANRASGSTDEEIEEKAEKFEESSESSVKGASEETVLDEF